MLKKKATDELGACDQPNTTKTEQSRMAEVRPRKRAVKSESSENNPGKKQKGKKTKSKSPKNEDISETKEKDGKSDFCHNLQQDPQQELLDVENLKTDTGTQPQSATSPDPKEGSENLRRKKLEFLDKINATRTTGESAAFWRTSPFQKTSYFTNCVNELEKTERRLKDLLDKEKEFAETGKLEGRIARKHFALAKTARDKYKAIFDKDYADYQHIKNASNLLVQSLSEQFEKELD